MNATPAAANAKDGHRPTTAVCLWGKASEAERGNGNLTPTVGQAIYRDTASRLLRLARQSVVKRPLRVRLRLASPPLRERGWYHGRGQVSRGWR